MRNANVKLGLWVGLSAAMTVASVGCGKGADAGKADHGAAPVETAVEAQAATPRKLDGSASTRLETALRSLDRGTDIDGARRALESVISDESATPDEQDEARIGLSRARESLGDKEGAITAIEELIASHASNGRFPAREAAVKRIRKLLTGSDAEPPTLFGNEPYAPVAKALAGYFDPDEEGDTLIDVLAFGSNGDSLEQNKSFAIAAAKRDLLRQACSFCENSTKVFQSISRSGSWVDMLRVTGEVEPSMPQLDRSMVVVLFDLESNRVPSRYDEYLALPSAEIAAHLEKGEGLIAVRERKGARPTIVIAAPRTGQLPAMEEAFSKLTTIPKEPLVVAVEPKLTGNEIQGVVRANFGLFRSCYEELLKRDSKAGGKVNLKFEIAADGTISTVGTDPADTTLADEKAVSCMVEHTSHLRFPASGHSTKVGYPVVFSND